MLASGRGSRAALCAAYFCVCLGASAMPARAEWTGALGVDAGWQQVKELDGGNELVRESGYLYGLTGSLARIGYGWRFGLDASFSRSALDYDGSTQFGAPLNTDTDWQGAALGMNVTREVLPRVHLGAEVEVQFRERDIHGTADVAGLDERYRTVWLGLRAVAEPFDTAAFELNAGCAMDSRVDVRFDTFLDRADLTIDDHCRAGASAVFALGRTGASRWLLRPFVLWEKYPRTSAEALTSGGVPVGQVYLPKTEFFTVGVTVGIGAAD